MKPFFCKTAIALSLTFPAAANAAEYVCNVEGITVYASHQLNNTCRAVDTNNTVESSVTAEPNVFTESETASGKTVTIPGDMPVLKTVQTTEFKATSADYINTPRATPAVQTPVIAVRNENGIPAPISIPMAQIRQTVLTNKPSADSVMVSNNTPALETPTAEKPENNVVDTTVHNTVPVVQTQTTAVQADSTIVPPMLAAQTQPTVATDKAIADGVIIPNNTPTLEAPPTIKAEDYIADTTVRNTTPVAPAQPTASTEKTVSDGLAILNETTVDQPIVPAVQIPQEIVQNPTVQPQISASQKSHAVTTQDEALDKTPAKVETKRKGKTYAKTSSRRKAKFSRSKADKTDVVHSSEEQAAKPITTASSEPSTPATATPAEHGKTTAPTPFPKAYKPAADILLDKGNNDSDIKILPNVPITSVTNTAEAANPRLNIILRNRPGKSRASSYSKYKAPVIRTAPVVTPAPKPSPKETRKQILQTEVRNEQAAITRLQTQLNVAKQKGDQIKIQQLTRTINARKANIRAIQGEMSR